MKKNLYCFGVLACASVLLGCGASKPTAHIIINNENAYNTPVNVTVSLAGKGEQPKEMLPQTAVKPGLQFIPGKKYKKGTYYLKVGANDGSFNINHPITLDTDRWIIINYMLGDSANIVKTYGYLDTTSFKKVNGRYANLDVYIDNRRPPNL